jgi:hypothetical protein
MLKNLFAKVCRARFFGTKYIRTPTKVWSWSIALFDSVNMAIISTHNFYSPPITFSLKFPITSLAGFRPRTGRSGMMFASKHEVVRSRKWGFV